MPVELEYIVRILVAGLLGGVIGIEREYRAKEAGVRTHFLVSLGSALMMVVSMHGFGDMADASLIYRLDPGRMAAQVVSGIGFIGAGAIMMHKQSVRGLTTAAGLWAACGIGLAIGGGLYVIGLSATLMTILGLEFLRVLVGSIRKRHIHVSVNVSGGDAIPRLSDALEVAGFTLTDFAAEREENTLRVSFDLVLRCDQEEQKLFKVLESLGEQVKISEVTAMR